MPDGRVDANEQRIVKNAAMGHTRMGIKGQ